jgi:hypothetical protein
MGDLQVADEGVGPLQMAPAARYLGLTQAPLGLLGGQAAEGGRTRLGRIEVAAAQGCAHQRLVVGGHQRFAVDGGFRGGQGR